MPLAEHQSESDQRLKIERCSDTEIILFKSSIEQSDEGTYRVHLANALGGDEVRVNIGVLTPPSEPQKPLRITNVKDTSYLLSWRPPMVMMILVSETM